MWSQLHLLTSLRISVNHTIFKTNGKLMSGSCAQVLFEPNVPKAELMKRAKALKKLGQIFQVVENIPNL